jgi:hypothetical protein
MKKAILLLFFVILLLPIVNAGIIIEDILKIEDNSNTDDTSLMLFNNSVFLVASYDDTNDYLDISVFSLNSSLNIHKNTSQYIASNSYFDVDIEQIDSTHFIIVTTINNMESIIRTYQLNTNYSINLLDSITLSRYAEHNDLLKINSSDYALAFKNSNTDDGYIYTFRINSSYDITTKDYLIFDSNDARYPSLEKIDDTHLILAYGGLDFDGYINTFNLDSNMQITLIDSLEHNTAQGFSNSLVQIDSTHFILAYQGSGYDGYISTFSINGSYVITKLNTIEHDTLDCSYNSLIKKNESYYILTYQSSSFVNAKTFYINNTNYNINEIYKKTLIQGLSTGMSQKMINSTHFLLSYYNPIYDSSYIMLLSQLDINNIIPTTPTGLSLTNPVYVGSTLTATGSGSTDAENDSITYYYEFYNTNSSTTIQAYSTDNTYVIAASDAHDLLRVRTKSYDGYEYSSSYKEANKSVSNTAPSVSVLTIQPASATATDNLTFTNTTTDVDSDAISDWSIKWYKNAVQQVILNNESIVNDTYLVLGDNWTVSLAAYDTVWSNYTNSSTTTIGDATAPNINTLYLSAASGVNDAPFSVYSNITELNTIASVIVEIQDPNLIKTNYSMSLFSGVNNNGIYRRIYTPSTDGVYRITGVFAIDGSGNKKSNITNVTYTESTSVPVVGGGGGGESETKKDCKLIFDKDSIKLTGTKAVSLQVYNNDTVNFIPNVKLPIDLTTLKYTIPVTVIQTGQYGELNFVNTDSEASYSGIILITSSECKDIELPITINSNVSEDFLNKILFNIGSFAITNLILILISGTLGLLIALGQKKSSIGLKFLIVSITIIIVISIFNSLF